MIITNINDPNSLPRTQSESIAQKMNTPKRNQKALRFPEDIETSGHRNIIRFNINAHSGSKYLGSEYGSPAGIDPATGRTATPRYMEDSSNSLARRFSGNSVRIDTTIDLYMPSDIQSTYTSNWNSTELGVTGVAADAAMGLGNIENWDDSGAVWETVKQSVPKMIQNTIAGAVQAVTPINAMDLKTVVTQGISNPYMEVLFDSIDNRRFSFTFKMIPRNASEQNTIHNIVKQFKFHRAPEVQFTGSNQYWIFPSTFDITFIHKNRENQNLFRISTCALTSFNVNHSPEGQYSSHADGTPFSTTISLEFLELEALTKERIAQGF